MKTTTLNTTKTLLSTVWFVAFVSLLALSGCGKKDNGNNNVGPGGVPPYGGGFGGGFGGGAPGSIAAAAVGSINTSGALAGELILEIRVAGNNGVQQNIGSAYNGQVEATGALRVTREDPYCGIPRGDYSITPVPGRPGTMTSGPTGTQPTVRNLAIVINGPFGPIQVTLSEFYLYAKAPAIVPFNGGSYPFTMFGWMQITSPPPSVQVNTAMCRDVLSQFIICRYGDC